MPSLLSTLALASTALAAGHASFPIKHRTVHGSNGISKRASDSGTFSGALLRNNSYTSYIVDLEIGTPPQLVSLSVDTGSSVLWMNPDCKNAGNKPFCATLDQFNPSDSSTWKALDQTTTISYGSGNATLQDGRDVVTIPAVLGGDDLTIPAMQFGVATETYIISAGILGVCFGEAEGATEYPSFIDQLALNNLTNGRVFSMALGNLSTESSDATGNGVMIFGGIDTKKFTGPLVPLPNLGIQKTDPHPMERYWVTMQSITINGTSVVAPSNSSNNYTTINKPITTPQLLANSSGPVIMDSGTTFLQLPVEFMKSIATAMGGFIFEDSAIVVDCDWMHSEGSLQFTFGDSSNGGNQVVIDVPLAAAVFRDDGEGLCGLGIQPTNGDIMIMGDVLLRQAYLVFDQDNKYIYMAPFADCGSAEETLPLLGEGEFYDYTGQCKTSAFEEESARIASAAAAATATGKGGSSTSPTGSATSGTSVAKSPAERSFAVSAVLLMAGLAASLML